MCYGPLFARLTSCVPSAPIRRAIVALASDETVSLLAYKILSTAGGAAWLLPAQGGREHTGASHSVLVAPELAYQAMNKEKTNGESTPPAMLGISNPPNTQKGGGDRSIRGRSVISSAQGSHLPMSEKLGQEFARHLGFEQPVAVLREHRRHPNSIIHAKTD